MPLQHMSQFARACHEAKTQDELARAVMNHFPEPYVYSEGCDTGIFTVEEYVAVCSLDATAASWEVSLLLLKAVKNGSMEVWNSEDRALTIVEIARACTGPERMSYRVVDLPLPADRKDLYPREILLPFSKRR